MMVKKELVTLRDGRQVILRSPGAEDAGAMVKYLHQINEETHYLTSYPEEITATVEEEAQFLRKEAEHPCSFQMAAFEGERPVAFCGVNQVSPRLKLRHRATLGITVLAEFWNCGLGTLLLEKCIAQAKQVGFEQVELGVYSDNPRAIHVYEKLGFQSTGVIPRAFRLKDGTYLDEILMTLFL